MKRIQFFILITMLGVSPLWAAKSYNPAFVKDDMYGDQLVLRFKPSVPDLSAVYYRKKKMSVLKWKAKAKKSIIRKYLFPESVSGVSKIVVAVDSKEKKGTIFIWHEGQDDFVVTEDRSKLVITVRKTETKRRRSKSYIAKSRKVSPKRNSASRTVSSKTRLSVEPLTNNGGKNSSTRASKAIRGLSSKGTSTAALRRQQESVLGRTPAKQGLVRYSSPPPANQKRITLNVKDADIAKVLRALAAESGQNVVFGDDIVGKVTVNLKNVGYRDAVKNILKPSQFTAEFGNGVTLVRARNRSMSLRAFQWRNVDVNDVDETIKAVLTEAQISVDSDTNIMFVRATAEDLSALEDLQRDLDVSPKQVEVEAAIVELSKDDDFKYGFDWSAPIKHLEARNDIRQSLSPLDSVAGQGMFVGLTWKSVSGILGMFQTQGDTSILARPRIVALNDETAEIIIGDRIGYRTITQNGTISTENINFLTVGTQLEIQPHITENLDILMSIKPEVSSGSLDAATNLPSETTTSSSTKVLARNGQTIVIGGLIRDQTEETENKVPVLGDIPLLGLLFRGTTEKTTKNEVVILLSPKIVDDKEMQRQNKEAQELIRNLYDKRLGADREEPLKISER